MKIYLSAFMAATLIVSGCAAPQTDPNKPAVADATQAKKKCDADATTGSRMRSCNGMSGDMVQGQSGEAYRDGLRSGSAAKNN